MTNSSVPDGERYRGHHMVRASQFEVPASIFYITEHSATALEPCWLGELFQTRDAAWREVDLCVEATEARQPRHRAFTALLGLGLGITFALSAVTYTAACGACIGNDHGGTPRPDAEIIRELYPTRDHAGPPALTPHSPPLLVPVVPPAPHTPGASAPPAPHTPGGEPTPEDENPPSSGLVPPWVYSFPPPAIVTPCEAAIENYGSFRIDAASALVTCGADTPLPPRVLPPNIQLPKAGS